MDNQYHFIMLDLLCNFLPFRTTQKNCLSPACNKVNIVVTSLPSHQQSMALNCCEFAIHSPVMLSHQPIFCCAMVCHRSHRSVAQCCWCVCSLMLNLGQPVAVKQLCCEWQNTFVPLYSLVLEFDTIVYVGHAEKCNLNQCTKLSVKPVLCHMRVTFMQLQLCMWTQASHADTTDVQGQTVTPVNVCLYPAEGTGCGVSSPDIYQPWIINS